MFTYSHVLHSAIICRPILDKTDDIVGLPRAKI